MKAGLGGSSTGELAQHRDYTQNPAVGANACGLSEPCALAVELLPTLSPPKNREISGPPAPKVGSLPGWRLIPTLAHGAATSL
jgi:hypothetical protein